MPSQKAFFWVDWCGFLWFGPQDFDRWKRFEGVDAECTPIWVARDLDDWAMPMDLCSYDRAAFAVNMFVRAAQGKQRWV